MSRYLLYFTTTIRGAVTVEADSEDHALQIGDKMARGTLNYDELADGGTSTPDVETECDDIDVLESPEQRGEEHE
jgi:hypothetical protein